VSAVADDVADINTKLGAITQAEFSYLDGVTSSIQTQLGGITTVSNDVAAINTKLGDITQTEFSHLDGVTSSIQTQLGGITTVSNDVAAINTKLGDITQTEFSYLDGVTSNIQDQIDGVGLGEAATVESTTAAQFEVKSTNALISGVSQVKMSMILDRGATANDYEYRTWNHYGHMLTSRIRDSVDLGLYGFDQDTGCMTVAGGRYLETTCNSTVLQQWVGVPTDLSAQFLGRASFRHGLRLPISFTPGSATAAGTEGDLHQDGDYVWVRGASEWKKAELKAFGASAPASGPTVYYHDHNTGNTGAQSTTSNWFQLPNNTDIEIHVGGTGGYTELNRYLYRLPLNPIHGQKIKVYNAAEYVAFSNINNSVSFIYVKNDSATAPHQLWGGNGGTAGNMCMKLDGHSAEIVMRIRSYINEWVMHSSSASIVARTTI
jgi:hypothetical protein